MKKRDSFRVSNKICRNGFFTFKSVNDQVNEVGGNPLAGARGFFIWKIEEGKMIFFFSFVI
jgi:hypothetical protein